ncbi:MAG: homocysteine methyltransferase [Clostridiaceae bacterium]|nr:homocysteine methyltransferase [Clostridiaceae bacterium]
MRSFLGEIEKRVLIYDGSKGYVLQKFGLKAGECPESWNITHSDVVRKIYSLYKEAGSDIIQTNTFPGNGIYLERYGLRHMMYEINYHGARLAREVMGKDGFVAGDIGPTGKLFEPSGELGFEEAYQVYREQVKALEDGGVDVINFETFNDIAEMRAALLAAKENSKLPVICSLSFEQNGRTLMGTDPQTAVVILKTLGADMVGTNCSFGAKYMLEIVKKMHEAGGGYLSVKPNAGLPEIVDGVAVYRETDEEFASTAVKFLQYGARLVGGCCGTTPGFIRALRDKYDLIRENLTGKDSMNDIVMFESIIASSTCTLNLGNYENIRIGKLLPLPEEGDAAKDFLRRVKEGNMEIVEDIALDLATEGYDAIYACMSIAGEDGKGSNNGVNATDIGILARVVNLAQGYLKQPVIIETDSPGALEKALRIYNGRAGVVHGKGKNRDKGMDKDFELVTAKYGALVMEPGIVREILV